MISTTIERLDFFLVAFIFVGQSLGNEYMMTCQRPVVTKSPRLLRLDLGLPCDLSKQSWCNIPGDKYPWHAVRSFVFENQGLMRRMYGEVRQLSVLRMEFNGNSIDESNSMGREFDELFKPISPTSSTTTTTTSSSSSSSTQPPLVTQFTTTTESSTGNSFKSTTSPPPPLTTAATTTAGEASSSTVYVKSNNVLEDDVNNNNSNNSDGDKLSRNVNGGSSNSNGNSAPVLSNLNGNVIGDDGVTGGGSISSSSNSLADTVEPFIKFNSNNNNNDEGYFSDQSGNAATTTEEGQTEGTTTQYNSNNDEADIFTTESIHHILFQDAERVTTTSTTRPTTDDDNNNNNFESSSSPSSSTSSPPSSETTDNGDTPQQIHRSDIKGVNACPVKEEVVAPYWANNTRGEVLALLNLYPFEQYIHWEKCTFEHRQMYCREGCRCEQQYRLHRLLAFDPTNECRGIFSDWFRFPSCCVCKCYLTSSDLAQERFSFNRSPRFEDAADIPDVNGVDDSHFYYKSTGFNSRQPRR